MADTLIVMAKAPIPGYAKTRLIPLLGPGGAAAFQQRMIVDTFHRTCLGDVWHTELHCAPDAEHPVFRELASHGAKLLPQTLGDLGVRMASAFASVLANSAHAVMIGTDCPLLDRQMVAAAFLALKSGQDVVLGPADDGGYYLIGMSVVIPVLFSNMPWSTPEVLDRSLQAINRQGLRVKLLETLGDIDTPQDYARYQQFSRESSTM